MAYVFKDQTLPGGLPTTAARLRLPVAKQGNDLADCLRVSKRNSEALDTYARTLEDAAKRLREVAGGITNDVTIEVDAPMIWLTGRCSVLGPLIEKGLLEEEKEQEEWDYYEDSVTWEELWGEKTFDEDVVVPFASR